MNGFIAHTGALAFIVGSMTGDWLIALVGFTIVTAPTVVIAIIEMCTLDEL